MQMRFYFLQFLKFFILILFKQILILISIFLFQVGQDQGVRRLSRRRRDRHSVLWRVRVEADRARRRGKEGLHRGVQEHLVSYHSNSF
jgi:hypothetical protein